MPRRPVRAARPRRTTQLQKHTSPTRLLPDGELREPVLQAGDSLARPTSSRRSRAQRAGKAYGGAPPPHTRPVVTESWRKAIRRAARPLLPEAAECEMRGLAAL